MPKDMNIGCVLMAAGTASRFGENKLLARIKGRPLIRWVLNAAPASLFARAVAVVSDETVAELARQAGYACVFNTRPERGQGSSIVLGTQAMRGLDATLFLVADQPFLRQESIEKILAAHEPGKFTALAWQGKRGNPVLFPGESFAELLALAPEETGRAVLRKYPDRIALVEAADAREMMDVDTKEDLSNLTE